MNLRLIVSCSIWMFYFSSLWLLMCGDSIAEVGEGRISSDSLLGVKASMSKVIYRDEAIQVFLEIQNRSNKLIWLDLPEDVNRRFSVKIRYKDTNQIVPKKILNRDNKRKNFESDFCYMANPMNSVKAGKTQTFVLTPNSLWDLDKNANYTVDIEVYYWLTSQRDLVERRTIISNTLEFEMRKK